MLDAVMQGANPNRETIKRGLLVRRKPYAILRTVTRLASKTQIDKLGERLRGGNITDADLRALDEYRRSFAAAYDEVNLTIRKQLGLNPTGRPAKSTSSIIEKLRRETLRLSQMQDIAGCRIVVPDLIEQDHRCRALTSLFSESMLIDRRERPSHGYRAVHIVINLQFKAVEVQVRTALQHLWAELCEKAADVFDPAIKYGGGPAELLKVLLSIANKLATVEGKEATLLRRIATFDLDSLSSSDRATVQTIRTDLDAIRITVVNEMSGLIGSIGSHSGEGPE